jgi:hypothetical protein
MNKRNYKRREYVNGYEEKIGYWLYKVNQAVEHGNWEKLEYANQRLVYFLQRQEAWKKETGNLTEYKIETIYG